MKVVLSISIYIRAWIDLHIISYSLSLSLSLCLSFFFLILTRVELWLIVVFIFLWKLKQDVNFIIITHILVLDSNKLREDMMKLKIK